MRARPLRLRRCCAWGGARAQAAAARSAPTLRRSFATVSDVSDQSVTIIGVKRCGGARSVPVVPFSVVCRTAPLPLVVEVLGAHDVFSRVDAFRLNFGWIGAWARIKIGGDVILDTAHIVDRNDTDRAAPKAGLLR
jgi:hypothetical protein